MESDQESLEALQKWWKENGRSVVTGLVLGLGGVFAFTSWRAYVDRKAEEASAQYQQVAEAAARDDHAAALAQAESLIEEFPDSGYAPLAALIAARGAFASDQVDEAVAHLRWTIDNAPRAEVKDVARIRLARVELHRGSHDAALGLLDAVQGASFGSLVDEVRGDVLVATGDADGARDAYAAALTDPELSDASVARVQMKLDDLGPAKSG